MRTIHARRRRLFRGFWGPVFRAAPLAKPPPLPPRTPAGKCPLGPFPLTAANTGARGARAPYKMGRASRRLREYLARFLGVSGADFNAAPLGKPHLRPPRRGAKTEGFTSGNLISRLRPSPTCTYPRVCVHHFHAAPRFPTNFILSHFLHPLGSPPRMHLPGRPQPERLVCSNFKSFLQTFPFVPKRWNRIKNQRAKPILKRRLPVFSPLTDFA